MFEESKLSASSKLLVVADDPDNRHALSRRLAHRGYAVEVAESGAAALAKINQAHYDLVLLDQMMPGTSGLDLLRLLRATYSQTELPVIMVAALGHSHSVADALDQGANDYVVTPGDLPAVAERIQAQLVRSQADRQTTVSDPLTGLSHRGFFLRRLGQELTRRHTAVHEPLAVLLINLDGFKMLNDSFGHEGGDQVLIEAATRFHQTLTDETALTGDAVSHCPVLARIGGDEFAVLLNSVPLAAKSEAVAQALLSCLAQPFALQGSHITLSASVGIAVLTSGGATAIDLLSDADLAMTCAKQRGKNGWELFDPAMRLRARARMAMAIDLRFAIERNQLVVFYQPKMNLATRSIVGFEALLRWRHPLYGLVPPADFIPIAEETGVIVPVGAWVLRQACMQLKSWHAKFPCDPPLSMNVNLSVKQLGDPELFASVASVLAETGIPPECLNLELTESSLVSELESARDVLSRLQSLHVGLDLDDFGTGYSSFSYLRTLNFDALKIDRSFINRLESDSESRAIVETILNLARTLHMEVVAEGIETEEQLAKLVDLGCATGQGFLFSKPVAAELAEQLLAPVLVT